MVHPTVTDVQVCKLSDELFEISGIETFLDFGSFQIKVM
jgi:hypothetical protein